MLKVCTFFFLISVGQSDVLSLISPLKEKDNWKRKVEAMGLECSNLQKELIVLQENVKAANSLQEVVRLNDSLSSLAARSTKLKDPLIDVEERYIVAFDSIEEKACQGKE